MQHQFSAKNQIVSEALDTYFTRVQIGARGGQPVYEHHRVTSKKWQWIAMDEATARACVRLTRQKYTRELIRHYTSAGEHLPQKYQVNAATVKAVHDEAGIWHVDVDLLEDQMQYTVGSMDVSPLWDLSCDYDEAPVGGVFVAILGSSVIPGDNPVAAFDYEVSAADFSATSSDFHIETAATPDAAVWTSVKSLVTTSGPGHFRIPSSALAPYVRIRWRDVPSAAVANPTRSYSGEVALAGVSFSGTWTLSYSVDVETFDPALVRVVRTNYDGTLVTDLTLGASIARSSIVTTDSTPGNFAFRVYYDGVHASNIAYSPYNPAYDIAAPTYAAVNACAFKRTFLAAEYAISVYSPSYNDLIVATSTDGITWTDRTIAKDDIGSSAYCLRFARPSSWAAEKVFAKIYVEIPVPGEGGETERIQATGAFELPFADTGSLVNFGAVLSAEDVKVYFNPFIKNFYSGDLELWISSDDSTWNYVDSVYISGNDFLPYISAPAIGVGGIEDHCYKFRIPSSGVESAAVKCPMLPME